IAVGARDAVEAQSVHHVLRDRHVRPERIALEDHRHPALFRRQHAARRRQAAIADPDLAGFRLEKACHQAQRRCLAAARGAEQGHQLARAHVEVEAVHRRDVAVALGEPADADARHNAQPLACRAPSTSRPSRPCMTTMVANVVISMKRPSTAIAPNCPSSFRSKMTTDITLVLGVNRMIDADSSLMTPMKTKHQVAMMPLRASGAVISASTRRRPAPRMRPASSSSGWMPRNVASDCEYPTGSSFVRYATKRIHKVP